MKRIAAFCFSVVVCSALVAQTLHMVRIEGLPEQAIGQKILADVFMKAGIKADFEALPGARAKIVSNAGEKDGETARIFGYGAGAPTMVRIPTPYYFLESAVFVKKGSAVTVKSKDDLKNYKVGIVRGVQHTIDLTAGLANVQTIDSSDMLMKMLDAGRIDLALTSKIDGDIQIKTLKLTSAVFQISLAKLDLFSYLHEKNKAIVPKVDSVIAAMAKSGELAKLAAKYEAEYLATLK